MTVYVDQPRHELKRGPWKMIMCHMTADTLDELNEMADKIGVSRHWIQTGRYLHYDICKAKRKLAREAGALSVDNRQMPALARACA